MTKRHDPELNDRLQRMGREWFAQVRRQDQLDESAERKRRRDSGPDSGDGWFDGWFSSDCASGTADGDCGD